MFVRLLSQKKGLSFGIIPGGFQEATLSKLGTDRVWMKNRKGLIKVRLQSAFMSDKGTLYSGNGTGSQRLLRIHDSLSIWPVSF